MNAFKSQKYDYLIVGSGLFGSVFAHEMQRAGFTCLVIDKRGHSGGNIYCEDVEGIKVHSYGAHIFHTDNLQIWNYVNSITPFRNFINSPLAIFKGQVFNLPFNMNTFNQLWNVKTPSEARAKLSQQRALSYFKNPKNLEEQALSLVGPDIYYSLIKGYTEKQWGRKANELPNSIIKRIPIRYTYDNNYFNDRYQGIPIAGYNEMTNKLLKGVDVLLNTDYLKMKIELDALAGKTLYTGPIDEFYQFAFGKLEYRSLRFDHERLSNADFQGNAVVNYTEESVPFTRIIEHKHFEGGKQKHTVITREYPIAHSQTNEPYYPINDIKNKAIYNQYKQLMRTESRHIFGGRLAEYQYYDMHQVIAAALKKVALELKNRGCDQNLAILKFNSKEI